MKKRADECLFCSNCRCYERVVSVDDGKTYDEVSCVDHLKAMHKHSGDAAPGIQKHFISNTGRMKRGALFTTT